ncbi:MAG: CocE/NonD family hydrolase [Chitinophagaceae bacterium]|nr:CocE/NonD family hydrolase [Chitinophagaceae bacterium]
MRSIVVYLLVLFIPVCLFGQGDADSAWIRENYVKSEHYITMRDGIRLYTAVYTPTDTAQAYPILMQRTPYSCRPYGKDNYRKKLGPNVYLMKEKYIFVYQDARGRYKSEGNFREMTPYIETKQSNKDVDESSDTYDTIEWLLKNTHNNGRVGIYGISFPGFYSSAALPDAHPALKAVSPQAPMSDEFIGDDCNHNGAFFLLDNFSFYSGFDGPRINNGESYKPFFETNYKDAYKFFLDLGPLKNANTSTYFYDSNSTWRQTVKHDTYDEYWQSRNIRRHLKSITPAVLVVGGWFDAEDLFGALKTYAAIEKQSLGNDARLVMGPWTHGGWAAPSWKSFVDYHFGSDLNAVFQQQIETPFFNYYLKDKGSFQQPEVTVFETGSNQWKTYDTWPPKQSEPVTYYFSNNKQITNDKPANTKGLTSYISDPNKPVPYTDGIWEDRNNKYMAEDQRFAAKRPDVIYFQTAPLTNDITLTGEIGVNLFVSTTGSDADFVVKVIDVWPDGSYLSKPDSATNPVSMSGYQQMLRADVFRGKFRKSFEKPVSFVKDKVEKVAFSLNEVAHAFKKGHRIMVQVQSSWFPLVDRNPQTFGYIPGMDKKDFKKATISIYHNAEYSSNVVLPVMKK